MLLQPAYRPEQAHVLQHYNEKSMNFLKAVLDTSGLGEETYLPEGEGHRLLDFMMQCLCPCCRQSLEN